jgi:protein involved in polysaccharide export with SLBB domain
MHRRPQPRSTPLRSLSLTLLIVGLIGFATAGCSGIKTPGMPKVPTWVPVIGSDEAEIDPRTQVVPIDPESSEPIEFSQQPVESTNAPVFTGGLQPGSTLRVAIYEGLRSTSRVFNAALTIDQAGEVNHRQLGNVRIAGLETQTALDAIETAYRLTGRPSAQTSTTHLFELDGSGVVQIKGAVVRESFLPHSGGTTLGEALQKSGGFSTGANPGKIYVIRRGFRQLLYLSNENTLSYVLNEGDIVSVPWAL